MRQTLDTSVNTAGLADEQRGLLDLVDKLQFAQLDDVKLPQIVVVGDQSAGKSSVLEALTGTQFPRDAGACTRFATEIRMRRAKEEVLNVSIIPDKSRPYNDQVKLLQFGGTVNHNTPFEAMMREAVELIAPKGIPGRFAAKDILVVEKRGPDMPLLTLVDLPGLVRVANRDQSEADIQTIEALSDRYMKSSRTIILAVIGGNNDYVQAPILKKARHFDPTGSRTIGVLTKPDLTEKIGLEDKFIGLVTNQDPENHFKLGWFVLLNPGPPGPGQPWPSAEQRKEREDAFFTSGKWSALPPNMCGVEPLRQKLSVQLQRHIGRHVNTLRKQIQDAHVRCEAQLKALGVGKDTVEEMRFQMGELFSASNNLVTASVNGNYKNPPGEKFFPKAATTRGTPGQKLRARVREESERFSKRFRDSGRKIGFAEPPEGGAALPNAMAASGSRSKQEFAKREVEPLLRQIRGTELPMDSNPRAPYILFQDYSENWPVLAQEYKDNISVICNEFLGEVIDYSWPTRMRAQLRMNFLEPNMKNLVERAEEEMKRLVEDMELEVQPFDPEYEERLRAWRAKATENGATYTEAEEVLEKMLIYYDLTARIFIRNIITQVVERHLLLGIIRLFNPIQILKMDDKVVEAIAAEDKQTRDRRLALKDQKAAIEEAKSLCASLAMRSELRGQDDHEDYVDSDDEDASRRYSAPPPAQHHQQQQHAQQSASQFLQRTPAPYRDPRYEGTHTDPSTPVQRKSAQEQSGYRPETPNYRPEPVSPSSARPSRADSTRVSNEWAQNYYTTGSAETPQAPASAPPPPPRPPKPEYEDDGQRYGRDGRDGRDGREREGKRESARHRIMGSIGR
ncbi:related to interferon-regulated resistance GTP-binding protein [Cephalotrichum gorgonifer]|uniref:Related to interferon-regulated resistance GTP-binding protein n=1 Tax=Cephalotrichum gorgonifer TaxID=2041049 RepID=A0AAE8MNZ9_9PEZI|nr:related to interferon-regulated resistance GTP-binding protein [Cephalotrichum gorgonifer]